MRKTVCSYKYLIDLEPKPNTVRFLGDKYTWDGNNYTDIDDDCLENYINMVDMNKVSIEFIENNKLQELNIREFDGAFGLDTIGKKINEIIDYINNKEGEK
jgi:hypothetical protein